MLRRFRRGSRVELPCEVVCAAGRPSQQLDGETDAEPRDIGRHVAEAALVLPGAQVDVDPRDGLRNEAREESRSEDMVAGILDAALLDVSDVALQELVE